MKWWLSRRVDEHFIFLSLSLLKKKSKKYFSLKYKYCLLSFCAQILYFVYIYILQLTIETNSPQRNLPFLLLMRSFPRSPPMRSTMAQSLTTLGDGTDWALISLAYLFQMRLLRKDYVRSKPNGKFMSAVCYAMNSLSYRKAQVIHSFSTD